MERNRIFRSSPYADPLDILNGTTAVIKNHILIPRRIEPNDREYCLQTYKKIFKKLIPIFIFILFSIFELILACFNCSYEDEKFVAIRVLLFLSALFLLPTFIYIIILFILKEIPDTRNYLKSTFKCSLCLIFSFFVFSCFELIPEMKTLNKIRNNSSIIDSLPCSINYYDTIFILTIIQLSFIPFVVVILVILFIREVIINECYRKSARNTFIHT